MILSATFSGLPSKCVLIMAPSFHSKIAQHIVELRLKEISKRNPPLGLHPETQEGITWNKLIAPPQTRDPSHSDALFPDDLRSGLPSPPRSETLASSDSSPSPPDNCITDPVAIIGGGVAGLRVAMMLKELGIPYWIYEASERYGGRAYTYHFKKKEGEPASAQNYFDVGAMRFPDNAANSRTFELFKELDITEKGGQGGKLLPFNLSTDDNILLFNGKKYLYIPAEAK